MPRICRFCPFTSKCDVVVCSSTGTAGKFVVAALSVFLRTVLRNGRTLFIVTYIPCDAKTREDFNAQNNNRAQSHRCRRRASPRGSDTVVLILNCSMLLMIYTVLEPLRGLVLPLSYLHTDMTYLLTKRNCFYKALTEI